jgi:hypothetical protein
MAPLGEHGKKGIDALDVSGPFVAPVLRVGSHFEVFEHGQCAEYLPPFRHVSDPEMSPLPRRDAKEVAPLIDDPPGDGRDRSGDRLEQGRLAGAVRADNGDELPLGHGE